MEPAERDQRAANPSGAGCRLLALGDSHIRVFESRLFRVLLPGVHLRIVYVPGGSALGILNDHSLSGARASFQAALARADYDAVLLSLGEVDASCSLWQYHEHTGRSLEDLLDEAVARYTTFIGEVRAHCPRVIVLGACLPTIETYRQGENDVYNARALVPLGWRERTRLAMGFNARLAPWCRDQGVPLLDSAEAALASNGLVRRSWRVLFGQDHHYARPPFALWLARRLRPLLAPKPWRS